MMNTSQVFLSNGTSMFNASNAILQEAFAVSYLTPSVATIGAIAATGLVLLSTTLLNRSLVDKHGNKIPSGPRGLPILGLCTPRSCCDVNPS